MLPGYPRWSTVTSTCWAGTRSPCLRPWPGGSCRPLRDPQRGSGVAPLCRFSVPLLPNPRDGPTAALAPAVEDALHLGGAPAMTRFASRLSASATACISSMRLAWWPGNAPGVDRALETVHRLAAVEDAQQLAAEDRDHEVVGEEDGSHQTAEVHAPLVEGVATRGRNFASRHPPRRLEGGRANAWRICVECANPGFRRDAPGGPCSARERRPACAPGRRCGASARLSAGRAACVVIRSAELNDLSV